MDLVEQLLLAGRGGHRSARPAHLGDDDRPLVGHLGDRESEPARDPSTSLTPGSAKYPPVTCPAHSSRWPTSVPRPSAGQSSMRPAEARTPAGATNSDGSAARPVITTSAPPGQRLDRSAPRRCRRWPRPADRPASATGAPVSAIVKSPLSDHVADVVARHRRDRQAAPAQARAQRRRTAAPAPPDSPRPCW